MGLARLQDRYMRENRVSWFLIGLVIVSAFSSYIIARWHKADREELLDYISVDDGGRPEKDVTRKIDKLQKNTSTPVSRDNIDKYYDIEKQEKVPKLPSDY